MIKDYKKIDLFGKTCIQKVDLNAPHEFKFPVADQACFLYMYSGNTSFQMTENKIDIPTNHALLLNCLHSDRKIKNNDRESEIIIITFHPDVLQKIYDKELPKIFQKSTAIDNQSAYCVKHDFLIHKYIEGLLFYFENPILVNEEILILKIKEIILLLAQTQNAETIQVILSQLFSPTTYLFKQIIEAHLYTIVSLEELAQKNNQSLSSFKREFNKIYKDSPASYIKNKKLERAAELLVVSNKRIADIAFECGFNDFANFTKSFHDKFAMSPTHYRLDNSIKD